MGKWPTLDKIEMIDGPIDDETYEHKLKKLQHGLLDLQVHHMRTGGRAVIGIDGWDAAGKGGADPAPDLRPRAALDPCLAHRRADATTSRAGTISGASGPAARARQLGDLRPHLVRPRAGRAHRGLLHEGGMEARLPRDQRVRAPLADDGVRIVKLLVHVSEEEQKQAHDQAAGKPAQALQGRASRTSATSPSASSISTPMTICSTRPTPTTRPGTSSPPTTSSRRGSPA